MVCGEEEDGYGFFYFFSKLVPQLFPATRLPKRKALRNRDLTSDMQNTQATVLSIGSILNGFLQHLSSPCSTPSKRKAPIQNGEEGADENLSNSPPEGKKAKYGSAKASSSKVSCTVVLKQSQTGDGQLAVDSPRKTRRTLAMATDGEIGTGTLQLEAKCDMPDVSTRCSETGHTVRKQTRAAKAEFDTSHNSKPSTAAANTVRKWTKKEKQERTKCLQDTMWKEFSDENGESLHFVVGNVKYWCEESDQFTVVYNSWTPLDNDTEELSYEQMKACVRSFEEERISWNGKCVVKEFHDKDTGKSLGLFKGEVHKWFGKSDTYKILYEDNLHDVVTYSDMKAMIQQMARGTRSQTSQVAKSLVGTSPACTKPHSGQGKGKEHPQSANGQKDRARESNFTKQQKDASAHRSASAKQHGMRHSRSASPSHCSAARSLALTDQNDDTAPSMTAIDSKQDRPDNCTLTGAANGAAADGLSASTSQIGREGAMARGGLRSAMVGSTSRMDDTSHGARGDLGGSDNQSQRNSAARKQSAAQGVDGDVDVGRTRGDKSGITSKENMSDEMQSGAATRKRSATQAQLGSLSPRNPSSTPPLQIASPVSGFASPSCKDGPAASEGAGMRVPRRDEQSRYHHNSLDPTILDASLHASLNTSKLSVKKSVGQSLHALPSANTQCVSSQALRCLRSSDSPHQPSNLSPRKRPTAAAAAGTLAVDSSSRASPRAAAGKQALPINSRHTAAPAESIESATAAAACSAAASAAVGGKGACESASPSNNTPSQHKRPKVQEFITPHVAPHSTAHGDAGKRSQDKPPHYTTVGTHGADRPSSSVRKSATSELSTATLATSTSAAAEASAAKKRCSNTTMQVRKTIQQAVQGKGGYSEVQDGGKYANPHPHTEPLNHQQKQEAANRHDGDGAGGGRSGGGAGWRDRREKDNKRHKGNGKDTKDKGNEPAEKGKVKRPIDPVLLKYDCDRWVSMCVSVNVRV